MLDSDCPSFLPGCESLARPPRLPHSVETLRPLPISTVGGAARSGAPVGSDKAADRRKGAAADSVLLPFEMELSSLQPRSADTADPAAATTDTRQPVASAVPQAAAANRSPTEIDFDSVYTTRLRLTTSHSGQAHGRPAQQPQPAAAPHRTAPNKSPPHNLERNDDGAGRDRCMSELAPRGTGRLSRDKFTSASDGERVCAEDELFRELRVFFVVGERRPLL